MSPGNVPFIGGVISAENRIPILPARRFAPHPSFSVPRYMCRAQAGKREKQKDFHFVCVPRYAMFLIDSMPSKKRSLLSVGPSDSGKSFFATLVRRQLPRSRVFLSLSGSEFCWNELDEKMHLIAFANDWRFTQQLPVNQLTKQLP